MLKYLSISAALIAFGIAPLHAQTQQAFPQQVAVPGKAQNSGSILLLSGPTGARFTLVQSADAVWRLHAGWNAGEGANAAQSTKSVLRTAGAPADEQSVLERPLTVFVDGPTGYTFIYALDEGWKLIGRLADRSH